MASVKLTVREGSSRLRGCVRTMPSGSARQLRMQLSLWCSSPPKTNIHTDISYSSGGDFTAKPFGSSAGALLRFVLISLARSGGALLFAVLGSINQ